MRWEHWLECFWLTDQDNASSLASRVKKTDAREIESFYQQYYEHYVRALDQGEQADRYVYIYIYIQMIVFYLVYFPWSDIGYNLHFEILDRAQLGKAYQTAGVLFEVLCAVNKTEKVEEVAPEVCPINSHCYFNLIYPGKLKVGVLLHLSFFVVAIDVHNLIWCHGMHHEQIIAAARDVQEKTEIYAPYNILPLDSAGASQAIMQLEEVFILLFCCGWLTDSSILFFNA